MVDKADIAGMRRRLQEIVKMGSKKGKIVPKEERVEKPDKKKEVQRKLARIVQEGEVKSKRKKKKKKVRPTSVPIEMEQRPKRKVKTVETKSIKKKKKKIQDSAPPVPKETPKPVVDLKPQKSKANGSNGSNGSNGGSSSRAFERVSLNDDMVQIMDYLVKSGGERKIKDITMELYGDVPSEREVGHENKNGRRIRNALRVPVRIGLILRVRDGVMKIAPDVATLGAQEALEQWKEKQRASIQ